MGRSFMATGADRIPFGDVLEAVDRLTPKNKKTWWLSCTQMVEQGRKRLAEDVREARQEFTGSGCRPVTTDELMGEILS